MTCGICREWSSFLSTPSARRATAASNALSVRPAISIHALREEGDHRPTTHRKEFTIFLSTPSARRATCCFRLSSFFFVTFLSTPSARRATRH